MRGIFKEGTTPEDLQKMLEDNLGQILGVVDPDGNPYPDAEGNQNAIQALRLNELYPFPDHPYGIRKETEYYQRLKSDIADRGVRFPIWVIKREDGDGYYIISGHTRVEISRELGLRTIPAEIKTYSMDEAAMDMVGSNIYRDDILPMEKARAYKIMNDAMKHQGKKLSSLGEQSNGDSELSSPGEQGSSNKSTLETIAETASESKVMISYYIKLNDLIPKFQDEVNRRRLGIKAGVQIANLSKEQQNDVVFALDRLHMIDDKYKGSFFNEEKAKEIRALSQTDNWGVDAVKDIISPPKAVKEKSETSMVWRPNAKSLASIAREFPSDVPVEEYEQIIKTLIHQHYFAPKKSEQPAEMTLDEQLKSPEWHDWLYGNEK